MTSSDALPEKDLLEKSETIKRFEYFLLGKGKSKPVLQKKSIKNLTVLLNLIKMKKTKQKNKKSRTIILLFTNITKLMNLLNVR